MKITLDGFLAPSLNEWQRMHWARRSRIKKSCVNLIGAQLAVSGVKLDPSTPIYTEPLNVRYTRVRRRGRPLDHDNMIASFKALGDALEALGVVSDDRIITIIPEQVIGEKTQTIIELDVDMAESKN